MAKSVNIGNLVNNKTKDGSKQYQALTFLDDVFVQVAGENVTKPENSKNLMAFVSGSPMQVVEKYGVNFGKDRPRFGILEVTKDYEGNVKSMRLNINEDVNIAKGSQILELNKYRTAFCNDPIENLEFLIKNGHIKAEDGKSLEETIETRRQKAQEASAWLLANVSVGVASSQ